jgi:hypothetical protein
MLMLFRLGTVPRLLRKYQLQPGRNLATNPNSSATSDETAIEATDPNEALNVDRSVELNGAIELTVEKDAALAHLTMDPEATPVGSAR